MFGRTKHAHTWGDHVMVDYFSNATVFSVVCTGCGRTGKYRVAALTEDEKAQREYVRMAKQNGWFK